MGLLDILLGKFSKYKCPSCKAPVDPINEEKCSRCGFDLTNAFVKICPNCGEKNKIKEMVCKKCGYAFYKKEKYRCPKCGFEMEYKPSKCPVCGVKFL